MHQKARFFAQSIKNTQLRDGRKAYMDCRRRFVDEIMFKKNSESLCGSDFLCYLCPVVPDMGDALGRRPRGRHTHWGKLMQTTMMPFPKLLK
jgi:hypothetical protein